MNFEIFHQLGFRHNWNFDSIQKNNTGTGVIFSPRSMDYETLVNVDAGIKQKSIFDPQFFLPYDTKSNLESYPFFPKNVVDEFNTQEFTESHAIEVAKACIQFQLENDFRHIIIPTRYIEATPSDFIEQQSSIFLSPFLQVLRKSKLDKSILLQLIISDLMLKDKDFITEILNWITSIKEINGIYLIPETKGLTKQIKDINYLKNLLHFIDILKDNDLSVVLGYTNTESIILTLADPDIITMGSYENTRIFRIGAFQSDKSGGHSPTPRLYVSKLLQFVNSTYLDVLIEEFGDILDKTDYKAEMFRPSFKWHFTKPAIYKHYFVVFHKQLAALSRLTPPKRYLVIKEWLSQANMLFKNINEAGIELDAESSGEHIPIWMTVANTYAKKKWDL